MAPQAESSGEYTDTTSRLAGDSKVTGVTVRKYSDMGYLDYIVASDGTRLFRKGQAARVREIYTQRMANRTRARSAAV